MTPANQKDINLLPKELTRAKKASARPATGKLVEYTSLSGEEKREPEEKRKKPWFFSRLFSVFRRSEKRKKPTLVAALARLPQKKDVQPTSPLKSGGKDLPQGESLPSALFANAKKASVPQAAPARAPVEDGIAAGNVMSMHSPDFLGDARPGPAASPLASGEAVSARALPGKSAIPVPSKIQALQASGQKEAQKIPWWRRWFGLTTPVQLAQSAPRPVAQPVAPVKPQPNAAAVVAQKADKGGETQAPVRRQSGFDVNLLSAEYTQTFKKGKPAAVLGGWAAVTVLGIGVLYGLAALYEMRVAARLAEEERIVAALNETIATYQDATSQDSVLRRKVAAARELVAGHLSWHAFLGKLEEVTIPEITYISMAASTKGMMNITAFAGDYTGLARQIVVFQQAPWIKDITVTAASRVEESPTQAAGVSFDLQIDISPDVLFAE